MGRLFIILGVGFAALFPVFGMWLGELGWNELQVCSARGLVGAVILGSVLRSEILSVRRGWKPAMLMATCFALGGTLYLVGVRFAPAGIVATVMYLGPLWVMLYDRLWMGRRRSLDLPAVILGILGTAAIATTIQSDADVQPLGIAIGLLTSFILATFIIAGKYAGEAKVNSMVIAFWGCVFMGVGFSFALPGVPITVASVSLATLLGLFCGVLYLTLLTRGIALTASATEAGILQYAELLFVILYFAILFGQVPSGIALVGTACILAAGVLMSISKEETHVASA